MVRITGSGMGCPDWPKCFGQWSPPTALDQLPSDYKQINAAIRDKKNQKFIRYLRAFGFNETAERIAQDKNLLIESDFNVTKAWIEYANRLVGVAIGFLIVAVAYRSVRLRKQHVSIFVVSLASLIAVIFQGWFGSIVVSTNLTRWTVTVHMFLALLIVGLLVYLVRASEEPKESAITVPKDLRTVLWAAVGVLWIQLVLGTEVREGIDQLASESWLRAEWIGNLGIAFLIHRSFSILVLGINLYLMFKLKKTSVNSSLSLALIVLLLGAFLTGVGMAYWAVPAVLQPLHLVLAAGAFGLQMYLIVDPVKAATT